jgi:hypothetical protein
LTWRKEKGGLGIPNLRDLNLCLIASWIQRYYEARDKIRRQIIGFKYSPNIFATVKEIAHPFRRGLCVLLKLQRWAIDRGLAMVI